MAVGDAVIAYLRPEDVRVLEPGGKSYTVDVPSKKTKKTYAVK